MFDSCYYLLLFFKNAYSLTGKPFFCKKNNIFLYNQTSVTRPTDTSQVNVRSIQMRLCNIYTV